jgi:tetratricopeptide (TPR) repeat protein
VPSRKKDKNRAPWSGDGALSPAALGLLAAFLAALLYLPALQYGWIWDDSLLVASKGAGGAGSQGFRPFASWLYRLEWAAGIGSPGLFHFTSIALHGLATWLVFLLARRVGAAPGIAFAATLLFAAHPVHVEAVAYVSGRPYLLATTLALASLLLATSVPVCAPGGCRNWRLWPAYGLFALAAFTEEVALATPFVLILMDRVAVPPRTWRERRVVYAGFSAVLLGALLARIGDGRLAVGPHEGVPQGAALVAPLFAAFDGFRALLLGWHLDAMRSFPDVRVTPVKVAWRLIALSLFLVLLPRWRWRDPLARAGVVLLVLPLLPALPLPIFAGPYLEERALYFCSVGFCLLVASCYAWLAAVFPAYRRVTGFLVIVVAGVAALGTISRLQVWRDNITLLQESARAEPRDPAPLLLLAEMHAAAGDVIAALAAVDRAIALDSTSVDAHHRRTVLLSRLRSYPDAEASARKTIALAPENPIAWANLGDILARQGRTAEAAHACRRAVVLDSTSADNWYNLGVALGGVEDFSGAILAYQRAIAINPQHLQAINNLGALMGGAGRLEEARDAYLRALELSPTSVEARMNLALAYLRLGDKSAAARERQALQRLDPRAARKLAELFRESGAPEAASDPSPPAR